MALDPSSTRSRREPRIPMLTNKGKYGLKALVHLAGLAPEATAQSLEIATAEAIPKKFLDAILGDLRSAGLVVARKGATAPATTATTSKAARCGC